ncbi:MAG TPA: DUF6766 family protein [Microbacterium sp.]|uniref:DUF6766 family protein n=1 Tax=Microbacterium sp. TaxID=51671 RepID=UPI002BECDDBC|nr:DUF6766 family protein [Microbacterium sp.]HWI31033.1 DUF6766 family protein [Microbacterium sp.]
MRNAIKRHGLSIFFGLIFVLALVGQSLAGLAVFNEDQQSHGLPPVTYVDFVTSSQFVVDVAENWQSEYLQFFLFILATVWLVQKGSPESKKVEDAGPGDDRTELIGKHARPDSPPWARAGGWRTMVYSNSLLLVMGSVFLASWLVQSIAGTVVFNHEQLEHGAGPITWGQYLVEADFWNRTLQNWQSEFLAVGSMIALSIYLRQRGSSESKPVGAPHHETAVEAE